ncbi:MAG: transposase [Hydrogenophaga sp.]|nr:transposase [Hydrogenophaga sp.]
MDFLKRRVRGVDRKSFQILENLRVHHMQSVKAWLAANGERTEVCCLPSHSLDIEPDEMTDVDLKKAVTKLAATRTKLGWFKVTARHLRRV